MNQRKIFPSKLSFILKDQSSDLAFTTLTRVNSMDLLKTGSPKSLALEKLRAKIQQQQLRTTSSVPEITRKCEDHIIREVCKVGKAEGIPHDRPVSRRKAQINPFHGKDHQINQPHKDPTLRKQHYTNISAWRDAQKLVKELLDSQCIKDPKSQKDKTKMHKKNFTPKNHQETAALNTKAASTQRSNQSNIIEKSSYHPWRRSSHHLCVKKNGNEDPAKEITAQIQNAQGVREYMQRQVLERRRREQQIKRRAELEQERRRKNVQDILKKQKEALHRTRKSQTQQYERCRNDDKEQFAVSNNTVALQHSVQSARSDAARPLKMKKHSDVWTKSNNPVCLDDGNCSLIIPAEAHRHRVEALKKTIASLNARVQNETVRLSVTSQNQSLTYRRHTDYKHKTADKKKESVIIKRNVPIQKEIKITADKRACPGIQNQQKILQCTSDEGEDTENTESHNKWSDLSGMCSRREFQCHFSLAQSQQFIWEEELRARQFIALFRLREKALWERSRAQLTWLEHCKKDVLSEEDSVGEIKKKQKEVVRKLRREEAEIHHWRNVYKCGQQQRRLLLHHHRDILDIKTSTSHIRQVLKKQAKTENDSRPRDRASAPEVTSLRTKPGIKPAAKGKDKLPTKQGRFFTKSGLRRLLTADEVWSLGRKRSLGEHNIPTEQEILHTTGTRDSGDPKCFSAYNHRGKPCHQTRTERKVKREDGKPSQKQELLKANTKPHGYEPAKNGKTPHLKMSQKAPKSNEIHSKEKIHWKSVKDLQHLTSEHNQPICGTSDKVPIGSCLTSDTEEDLPYDYEDIQQKPREETEARFKEKQNYSSFEMTVDCAKVITDNLTLNVKNSHQSVIFNNNHEICNVSSEFNTAFPQTHGTDFVSQNSENLKWQNIKDSTIDKALGTKSVIAVSSDIKGTDSLSCDDSLSEAEDKSEQFSLQSDGLVWSEEEKDVHSEEKSEAATFALVYAEKFTVIPESLLYCHKSNSEQCKLDSCSLTYNKTHITAESNLSEILSPVDEVLSYGSAEFPSSLKGESGPGLDINSLAPPSPAYEIITWTSEEDLLAPPDFLEDPSLNSENIPPLTVDLSCKKDTKGPSEKSVNNDANNRDLSQMFYSADEDQEDESSEYSSSFSVDESKDSKDLLSHFNIGDRVLVCNSRPGVLKYKGYTAFANGFWAGVALDTPKGNHNGTFRGVKYFTCQKSCGVLVRAEDISHLHGDLCNDANTRMEKDTFLNEDHSNNQDGKNGNKLYRQGQIWQSVRHSSPGHSFSASTQTFQQKPCENNEATDDALPMFLTSSIRAPLNIDCMSHLDESKDLVERLTEEIFADALKDIPGISPTHDDKSKEVNFMKKDVINKPGIIMDKWQQVYPVTPPQIRVKPHEQSIVYKLVDNAVSTLCGQTNLNALDDCETPSYLKDQESCETYRRVLFQLASDILNKICANLLEVSETFQKTMDQSVISLVQTRQISVNLLKDAVKRETQKVLNLGKNDQEMTEMLQTLCKYWYAKRDKVDYILIQELHSEEKEWVDYSNDQITVKMQLANDIFNYLLDDTIAVLNQIYE